MPRIRTMKPDFWSSPDVKPLSRDARLLFLGLISYADDDGRFLAGLNPIIGYVYPNDDDVTPAKARRWLHELTSQGVAVLYDLDGVEYGCIPTWHSHQVINRYTASKLPEPPCECAPRKTGAKT